MPGMKHKLGLLLLLLSYFFNLSFSSSVNLHWKKNGSPRKGIGWNLHHTSRTTLIVSDLQTSISFYKNVFKFEVIQQDDQSAILDAKTLQVQLKAGVPAAFSGDNLIVGHMALDIKEEEDFHMAFQYLKQKNIPFEINISVPKGEGKAVSEGGDAANTVGQAFIRDPDGYYYEICNCNVLTKFVMGTDKVILPAYLEEIKPLSDNVMAKLKELALDAQRISERVEPLKDEKLPKMVDAGILEAYMKRKSVFGDICNSFTELELLKILRQADNHSPTAIQLMHQQIEDGVVERAFQPPAFYVGEQDEAHLFKPEPLVKRSEERGRSMERASKLTKGQLAMSNLKTEENSNSNEEELDLEIVGMNHIGFIVSDVGHTSTFCIEVLGLQQVNRPAFDTYGAWFTGGNLEIHLIKGNPLAPLRTQKGSESSCTWFVVENLENAKIELQKSAKAKTLNMDINLEIFDDHVFVRSPDGYVFGICSEAVVIS